MTNVQLQIYNFKYLNLTYKGVVENMVVGHKTWYA